MLNSVILIGRVCADIELKMTQSGISVTSFNLAVERPKYGEAEKVTDFIRITAWRGTADYLGKYASKGRLIAVNGALQVRKYVAQDGTNKQSVEVLADNVQILEWPDRDGGGQQQAAPRQQGNQQRPAQGRKSAPADDDDMSDPFAED